MNPAPRLFANITTGPPFRDICGRQWQAFASASGGVSSLGFMVRPGRFRFFNVFKQLRNEIVPWGTFRA